MKLIEINGEASDLLINKNISNIELNKLLKQGILKKQIGGEQWFRKYENWLKMPGYSNPYKTPYHELKILIDNESNLKILTLEKMKVFYGIGTGDSEIIPILWDLDERKKSEIYVIDVITEFISTFVQSLKNLKKEYPTSSIKFKGNNTLFENLSKTDFRITNADYDKRIHICLGNTIGNMKQDTIFSIFKKFTDTGDFLMLGYQLNDNLNIIRQQYEDNSAIEKFILDSLKQYKAVENEKITLKWLTNRKESTIEAWIPGDIQVFRSRKYSSDCLNKFAKKYDFIQKNKFSHGDTGISVFEKK